MILLKYKKIEQKLNKTTFFRIVVIFGLLLFFSVTLFNYPNSIRTTTAELEPNTVEELYVGEESAFLETRSLLKGSIIRLNITVLPCSNATVTFEYGYPNITSWVPKPPNFSLSPGETNSQNYTLETAQADYYGRIIYTGYINGDGTNATIRWWYEILMEGSEVPAAGTMITVGALIITTVIFQKKRK
jgi:hypothetical protein